MTDTKQEDEVINSIGENLADKLSTPKKIKKHISFLLPGAQEPVPIDSEEEVCEDITHKDDEDALMIENEEQSEGGVNDLEDPIPEPTVNR